MIREGDFKMATKIASTLALVSISAVLAQLPSGPVPEQRLSSEATANAGGTPRYLLNSNDVIEFKFSYNSDMNEQVTIRPDGYVSLSMIGDVMARGTTPEELAKAVERKYVGILRRPEAVVIVREFSAQRIFIAGEVNAPGALPIGGKLTLAQALFHAGGPKPTARMSQVLLLRYQGSNHSSVQVVEMKGILTGAQADIALEPYDVVFVPRSKIAQVGLFVEQYVNNLVPRTLLFPYNINNVLSVHQ
jgi:polysaccharide export outer membrane protein